MYNDIGLYELTVIVVFGTIIQPVVKISAYAIMQLFFYEGIGVHWYPRNDVDHANSCEESQLLPWLRNDVQRSFTTLPGRMKIASQIAVLLERSMRFVFVQTAVNAFVISIFTTKTSASDDTVALWIRPEILWGYISINLFNITSAASVMMIRWEMNRWIRWYKRKTVAVQASSTQQTYPPPLRVSDNNNPAQCAIGEDGITALMKPLMQTEILDHATETEDCGEDQQVEGNDSLQLIIWYLAAAGCIVSWIAVISGVDIFELEYKVMPIPGERSPWGRKMSVYELTQDQYMYTYESLFVFRVIQFISVTIICFVVPSVIVVLCLVIETRKKHLDVSWMRTLVCSLQYLRFWNGSESLLVGFIIIYFESTRLFEGIVKYDIAGENYYVSAKYIMLPGTWFFITFLVSKADLFLFLYWV